MVMIDDNAGHGDNDKLWSADKNSKQNKAIRMKTGMVSDSASGSLISVPDGANGLPVKELSVSIEPVQDLHGYSNPWPGGAGGNLCNPANWSGAGTVTRNTLSMYVSYGTIVNARNGSSDNLLFPPGKYYIKMSVDSNSIVPSALRFGFRNDNGTFKGGVTYLEAGETYAVTKTITEACYFGIYCPAADNTGTDITIKDIIISTTDVPFENICPITGHDEAIITKCGKNLLKNIQGDVYEKNDVTFTKNADGSITINGTSTASGSIFYNFDFGSTIANAVSDISKFVGKTATASFTTSQIPGLIMVVSSFKSDGTTRTQATNIYTYKTFTYVEAVKSRAYLQVSSGSSFDNVTVYPMIEFGSKVTDFVGPDIQDVTIDLDGTIYSGTLNVLTGEMVVDRASMTLTGATSEQWGTASSGANYYSIPLWLNGDVYEPSISAMCDTFQKIELSERGTKTGLVNYSSDNGYRFSFNADFGITTTAELRTWLSTNNVQVVAKLANPQIIQLSPEQISTLLGENNLWSSTGHVSMTYRTDLKRYIDKKFAELQALALEN